MNLRLLLLEARALVAKGWCQSYLAVTADGEPTSHVGHEQAFPAGTKVSKNAVFLREEVRKGDDKDEKPKTFNVYSFPPVKWSLIGALLEASGSPSCGYPNKVAGQLFREFEPFYREWDFEFGTRKFACLSAFNDHSETRTEIDEATGKKKKVTEATTAEEVIRLIDCAIARIDLREGNARAAEVAEARGYTIDPRIAEAMRSGDPVRKAAAKIVLNSELPLTAGPGILYPEGLATKITETARCIWDDLDPAIAAYLSAPIPYIDQSSAFNTMTATTSPRATIAPITARTDLGENLSVYEVLGHTVVGMKEDGKHRFEVGELVVYVPEDMIVPEVHLRDRGYWDEAKGKGLLGGSKGNRVKARGFVKTDENPGGTLSVGLIWKTDTFMPDMGPRSKIVIRPLTEGEDTSVFFQTFTPKDGVPRGSLKVVEGDDVTDFFDLKPAT